MGIQDMDIKIRSRRASKLNARCTARAMKYASASQEFIYTTMQGYVNKGDVALLLSLGWEIAGSTPVFVGGISFKQQLFNLRKRNPAWEGEKVADEANRA
jgi:hypothetical protein